MRFPSSGRRQQGFTLVELLVVIGIIAILAGVALGPITKGIQKAKESGAMQTCRTLALAEFQYANDNNGTYPDGTSAGAIAGALYAGNYVTDPGIFLLSGDAKAVKYTGGAGGTWGTTNSSFDFMGTSTQSGVTSSSPDQLPLVWSPDNNIGAVPTGTTPQGVEFAPNNPIFSSDGIAVAYHSNNSFFRAPLGTTPTAPGAWPDAAGKAMFIDNTFNPNGVTYAKEYGALGY